MEARNKNNDFLANVNKQTNESFEDEKFTYQKTDYRKWIIQFVIIAIVIVAAYLFLNQKVEIIDFTHMSYQDVAAWAGEKDVIITVDSEYSSEIDADYVISQSIEPGEKVENNTNIIVVTSKGLDPYEKIPLPEFDSTWSRTSIQRWLEQNGIDNFNFRNLESTEVAGNYLISYRLIGATKENFMRNSEIEFTISDVDEIETVRVYDFLNRTLTEVDSWARNNGVNYTYTYDFSSIYDRDKIMYQSVVADEEINVDDTISFILSKGEETESVIMENFLNRTIIEADMWAKNNRVNYTYAYDFSSIYDRDKIMYQSIVTNEEIEADETIRFIISKGEEITIPSFSDISVDEARDYTQDNDISVEVVELYKEGTNRGDFISQSIAKGTKVEEGTTITVNYSLGDKVTIPNYTNQLRVDFEEWVREINEMGANISLTIKVDLNSTIEYGKIISQNYYNQNIGLSMNIELIVSSGIIVPSFSDMSDNEVRNYPEESVISVEVVEQYKVGTELGDFISQSIPAGTKVNEDTVITVNYSLGDTITIQNYTGQLKVDFENWVREQNQMGANITLTVHEDYVDDYILNESVEYGRIISQNIYNDNVDLSTNIEIFVSLGEEYRVVNFSMYPRSQIQRIAEREGLIIVVEEVPDTGLPSGRFISQEPKIGEIISKKDFIKIRVAE